MEKGHVAKGGIADIMRRNRNLAEKPVYVCWGGGKKKGAPPAPPEGKKCE